MIPRVSCSSLATTLLIIWGVTLLFLRIWIFDAIVSWAMTLGPHSPILGMWITPPVDVYINIHLFNWTNPEDIFNKSVKPRFEDVGPYSFKAHMEKVNITWNANDTVTFRMLQTYHFDEEKSNGTLSDLVTSINSVSVVAAHNLRYKSYLTKKGFSLSLGLLSPDLHVTKEAKELLFDGYQDPLVDLVQTFPFLMDVKSPYKKAGFFYGRNGSYTSDGIYNSATGRDGNTGEILNWNYLNVTPFFDDACAPLKGSLGELYNQRQPRKYIKFFSVYSCRNIILDYEKDVTLKNIHSYKFTAQHGMLDNGTLIPENKCVCNGECIPSGMLNVTSCSLGAPTFFSLPHFYGADPVYSNMIDGMRPEKDKHEAYAIVEPVTGISIDRALRFQMNLMLQPVEHVTLFEEVPKVIIPLLWLEYRAIISTELAWLMRFSLSLPNFTFPIIAVVLIVAGIALAVKKYRLRNKEQNKANYLELVPLKATKNDVVEVTPG